MTSLFMAGAFLAGILAGGIILARWYIRRLQDPDVVREILKNCYRASHKHWLHRSEADERLVCPCCGWSETETLAVGVVRTEDA